MEAIDNASTGGGSGGDEWRPLNTKETRTLAINLGYKEVKDPPFNSHGRPAFKHGNRYITPDRDGHRPGGVWKLFENKKRLGTYNWDLTVKIGP